VFTSGLFGVVLSALAAFATTGLVLRSAARRGLVQVPNARSSHSRPTPTGGGLGIAVGASLAGLALVAQPAAPAPVFLVAGLLVAALGFVDDLRPLGAGWRLLAQALLLGATIALGVPLLAVGAQIGLALPGPLLFVVLVLAGIYWVNIYNFMDGIDGLAASQALFMSLAGAGLLAWSAPDALDQPVFWWLCALGAASAGFLVFNWPPARIFMGDVGSTFLGFMLAALALATIASGSLNLWTWVILAAGFAADASVTLLRRAGRGEKIMQAHRSHAYQRLARRWGSHRPVTLLYGAVNLAWLLPLAAIAQALPDRAWMVAAGAHIPLIVACLRAGAGLPDHA